MRDLRSVPDLPAWLESGEKPTRFFFQLERERSSRSSVSSILNSDDVEVFTLPEIEQAHVSFYSRPFSEDFITDTCKERCLSGIQLTRNSVTLVRGLFP